MGNVKTTTPIIKVLIEMQEQTVMNGRKQIGYAHLGDAYPERIEVWVPDNGSIYPAGLYMATECYMSNDKYPKLVVGLSNLKPAKDAA